MIKIISKVMILLTNKVIIIIKIIIPICYNINNVNNNMNSINNMNNNNNINANNKNNNNPSQASLYIPFLVLKARKFALLYTLGSVFVLFRYVLMAFLTTLYIVTYLSNFLYIDPNSLKCPHNPP